jgi:hypothetical protein
MMVFTHGYYSGKAEGGESRIISAFLSNGARGIIEKLASINNLTPSQIRDGFIYRHCEATDCLDVRQLIFYVHYREGITTFSKLSDNHAKIYIVDRETANLAIANGTLDGTS